MVVVFKNKLEKKLKWLMKCKLMLYVCFLDLVYVVLMVKWIIFVYWSVFIED